MTAHNGNQSDDTMLVTDPVSGMKIASQTAAATRKHEGATFSFCTIGCADTFGADPHRYGHPHPGH